MNAIRFTVAGRVQGVGFRAWTRATASRLGVVGTVRNLPDGRVCVDAAAPPSTLETLRALLHDGPSAARVTRVTESPISMPDTDTFQIVY